jgi:hypothetical protein
MMRLALVAVALAALLAGCAGEAPALRAMVDPAEEVLHRVSWHGKAPAFAQACVVVPQVDMPCQVAINTADIADSYVLPPAHWEHARLTLTWTPTAPGQEMALALFASTPDCKHGEPISIFTTGSSPLVLDDVIVPTSDQFPLVCNRVWSESHVQQDPALLFANPEQPFHLEGEIHGVRE